MTVASPRHVRQNRRSWDSVSEEYQRQHARLLRPGGLFAFNHASVLHFPCWGEARDRVDERLVRDDFGMRRWDGESVDFMLPYGEWIRLFRANGLEVEDLFEPRPPAGARTTYPWFAPLAWARRFPSETIWKLRRRE